MLTRLIRNKCLLFSLIIILLFLVGCAGQVEGPSIELSEAFFDWGDVNPDLGSKVEKFLVKNTGLDNLEIYSVSTSCGCTDAEVDSKLIAPGETTTLTVTYDPSVHPGLVGKMERVVYIKSNDPKHEEVDLTLVGNSLPSSHVDVEKGTRPHDNNLRNFEISPFEVNQLLSDDEMVKLLDVRENFEFDEGHIDRAVNLHPEDIAEEALNKLNFAKEEQIIIYDLSGKESTQVYEMMGRMGYTNIKIMNGGITHWVEEGFDTEMETQHDY